MTAIIMDGKALAGSIRESLRKDVVRMGSAGVTPKLSTVLVGDDPASKVYVGNKHRAAQQAGISSENHELPKDTEQATLTGLLSDLSQRRDVHGILLQLPLPPHLNPRAAIDTISPEKDVDGLTSANMGKLFYGQQTLVPCTPKGVMALLHHYRVTLRGARAVIVNRSALVGKPLYHLLLGEDATVTTCHSKTKAISTITSQADILITAIGRRAEFAIAESMVKQGSVVIDVGMSVVDGKFVGDVEYGPVSAKAGMITPVPGGVGPMTIAMLLENTLIAASSQEGLPGRQLSG